MVLRKSTWILGDRQEQPAKWMHGQIEQLVPKLCGAEARFSSALQGHFCIVVGSPDGNRLIKKAAEQNLIKMNELGHDDFLQKQIILDECNVLIIAGNNFRAATYGVFDLFEQLGCTFLFSRDEVPATNPELTVPVLDKIARTNCSMRGIGVGAISVWPMLFMMSVPDHEAILDQMAKLKMNTMLHWHFEQDPFIDYTFKGERKVVGDIAHPDSGYINYGRHFYGSFLVKDIPHGQEQFNRDKITSMEMQNVSSSDEALDAGGEVMRKLMKLGKERGIGTWSCVYPQFTTPNFSKYVRRMPRTHLHWSAHLSCSDPAVTELNRARITGILKAYPDIEGIYLGIPEGFYKDPYPASEELIEREWDNYAEAFELHKKHWGTFWPDEKMQKAHIRADIAFVEILKNTIAVAKELKPDIKLGIHTVCKAYLLPYLDKILPKDIPFIDIESKALWTLDGAPLYIFQQIKGRECAIMPRAADDGSLLGLQFPMWQYHADGFLASQAENGTNGLITQISQVRGNEHTIKYLADGMWNPEMTPERFYQDYSEKVFGEEAAPLMAEAFKILEENDEYLGGRGQGNMNWNMLPGQIGVLQSFKDFKQPFHKAPFDKKFINYYRGVADQFKQAVDNLTQGIKRFKKASSLATDSGRRELAYMTKRTKSYRSHLLTLIEITDLYEHYLNVFDLLGDLDTFRKAFTDLVEEAKKIEKRAEETAGYLTDNVEHVTDLGMLWVISHTMGVGSRCLRQYLENILAFYQGREYWNKVDWDIMFGNSPFPAYDMEDMHTKDQAGEYEPG